MTNEIGDAESVVPAADDERSASTGSSSAPGMPQGRDEPSATDAGPPLQAPHEPEDSSPPQAPHEPADSTPPQAPDEPEDGSLPHETPAEGAAVQSIDETTAQQQSPHAEQSDQGWPQPRPVHPEWANPQTPAGWPSPQAGWSNPEQTQPVPQDGAGWMPPPWVQPTWPQRAVDDPSAHRSRLAGALVIALVAGLIGGGVGGTVGYALANRGSAGVLGLPGLAPAGSVEPVAAKVLPSVVQLRVEAGAERASGSGIVLSDDGLLLTNNHVVESAATGGTVVAVFQSGATAKVDIVGRDPGSDIAVLRAKDVSGLTPIDLGDSEEVRVGQQVVAFGSPLGLGGTVTTGIISALDRPVNVGPPQGTTEETVLDALQTDAAINPGNSGGPLVDMQGKVIGINSAIATTGEGFIGVGFAIPINQVRRVAEQLERTGKASRALLGVNVTSDPALSGARVATVVPGSAADIAGIRVGDLVIRFGDQRILAANGLQAAVRSRAPGEVVEVELADRTVQVTLAAAPG